MAGNANSGRRQEKPFRDALRLEIAEANNNQRGLRLIAKKLIEAAEEGKLDAIKEVADRLDGKVAQSITGEGEDGEINLVHTIKRVIVRANAQDQDG